MFSLFVTMGNMRYRPLGRTGWNVSEISFGAWAIGGSWGNVDDNESMAALHAAIDAGVNFIDTADVYGMGRSERLIARLKSERREEIIVATKAGRRLPAQTVEGYTAENLESWVNDSLQNLKVDTLDLLQLHCPPTALFYRPEVFGYLDDLVRKGKIRHYGVSVERVEEALKAIEFPGVQTVQIIFNCFRQRPAELFFPEAERRKVGNTCPGAPCERIVDRQTASRFSVCAGRSSQFQPAWRGFRRWRNVLRSRL